VRVRHSLNRWWKWKPAFGVGDSEQQQEQQRRQRWEQRRTLVTAVAVPPLEAAVPVVLGMKNPSMLMFGREP